MQKQSEKNKKLNIKLKKLGFNNKEKKFTHQELRSIAAGFKLRYIMGLENALARIHDQSTEDKAHLLLKEKTIQVLQEDVTLKNRKLKQIEIHQKKFAKRLNLREKNYDIIEYNLNLLKQRNMSIGYLESQIKYLRNKNNSNKGMN